MEENNKFATCKEFGKMLRAVADCFAKYGDEPLETFGPINLELKDACYFVTNRGAYQNYIQPWVKDFIDDPQDITAAIKQAKQVKKHSKE